MQITSKNFYFFFFKEIIIKSLNEYLCYKHSLEMWNLIFSIIIGFETENKSPDHAETWELRCRLIQDEDKDGGRRQRGFFATKLTADIRPA